ncbi:MAG: hypothetical protein RJA07_640 [Bacteroidota bacterium]|jgi:hypothetical protein
MKSLNSIGSYLVYTICLIGFILTVEALGTNMMLVAIGIAMMIPALVIFLVKKQKEENKLELKERELEDFKQKALKINVSLMDYTIKTNTWNDVVVISNHEAIALTDDKLMNKNVDDNIINSFAFSSKYIMHSQNIERSITRISFTIPYQESIIIFDATLDKNMETVKMLVEFKKETALYIDKFDRNKNYLDLDFLMD